MAPRDIRGNTPMHLVATKRHLRLLVWLLRKYPSEALEAWEEENDGGERVGELVDALMTEEDDKERLAERMEQGRRDMDGEEGWGEKLMRAMDSEDGVYGVYHDGEWHADEFESADEYAERIWKEMQDKKRMQEACQQYDGRSRHAQKRVDDTANEGHGSTRDTCRADGPTKESPQSRESVRFAGECASMCSRHEFAAQKAMYQAKWAFVCAKQKNPKSCRFVDIPWIVQGVDEIAMDEAVKRTGSILFVDVTSDSERKNVLRKELVRWHPDTFLSKFKEILEDTDLERIQAGVGFISQCLTELYSAQAPTSR